jgi:chemotaxis protein methyltransferase CheR
MTDAGEREFEFTQGDFRRVCELIRAHAGIALAESKYEMVYTRLVRRLRALGLPRFSDYLDRLERDGGEEWEHFTNSLTTNLTSFFREPHHFARPLRIWCCAASTGEEPWSLAIAACEAFDTLSPPVSILASDVDTNVLATAQQGVYEMDRVTHLSQVQLQRFFQRGTGSNEGLVRINPKLHELMHFRQLNLLDDGWPGLGPFDAIFCRNVMIYFDKPTQYRVLQNLMPLLEADGLLFAGHSESFFHAADLVRLREHTVYERVLSLGSHQK